MNEHESLDTELDQAEQAPRHHVMYNDKDGEFHSEYWYRSFEDCEKRLEAMGAIRWEIG